MVPTKQHNVPNQPKRRNKHAPTGGKASLTSDPTTASACNTCAEVRSARLPDTDAITQERRK